jgi:pyridoxal phosphate enzyme (YggS family)
MAARPAALRGTAPSRAGLMPPKAMQGAGSPRASAAQRKAPKPGAPGWLWVGKSGDRKMASGLNRRARAAARCPPWAAMLNILRQGAARRAIKKGIKPRLSRRSGRCSPAPSASAARPSPATSSLSPRCRASRATGRSSPGARPRATTPAPRGRCSMAARGSGRRTGSLNSHSRGKPPGLGRANRPQAARGPGSRADSLPCEPAMTDASAIAENLSRIRARIAEACARANRPANAVTLVAVSKTNPVEAVEAALTAGQMVFGENRVQEAAQKFPLLRPAHPGLRLHIIGGLQTNKARDAVRIADVIETLDRPKLAQAIAEAMGKEARRPDLLVQVNTGDEAQKSGCPRAEADAFIRAARDDFGLPVKGLMCIPPAEGDPRPHFAYLANLAAKHGLPILSMGMSGDFEAAIAEGATHVRVGSAIFGARG